MTYSLQAVTSFSQVVDEIVAFASARGWATTGGAGSGIGTIQNPSTGLVTTISGALDYFTAAPNAGPPARCYRPKINGSYPGAPVSVNPSQVHLFGNNAPYVAPDTEPFISAVVAFGFNSYRHIYIGTLVKVGDYADGDVIAINDFSQTYTDLRPYSSYQRYLFRAHHRHEIENYNGGAKITHADNATTWRQFRVPSGVIANGIDPYSELEGTEVFGGNGDGFQDGLVFRSQADFAAGQIMVPVNLYCSNGDNGSDYRIRPLGHVSGVRLVNMSNLTPEQQFSISSDDWRAFPEFSKRNEDRMDWSEIGTDTYWPYEYSWMFGLAYRENS